MYAMSSPACAGATTLGGIWRNFKYEITLCDWVGLIRTNISQVSRSLTSEALFNLQRVDV